MQVSKGGVEVCAFVLALAACGPPSQQGPGFESHETPSVSTAEEVQLIPSDEPSTLEAALRYESDAERALFQAPLLSDASERARLERKSLEGEILILPAPSQVELAQISSTWFKRGTGVLIQNATEHSISSTIHFFSSSNGDCKYSTSHRNIAPRASIAPSPPMKAGCLFDRATIKHYDRFSLAIKIENVQAEEDGAQ
jgi:hypothetical protein